MPLIIRGTQISAILGIQIQTDGIMHSQQVNQVNHDACNSLTMVNNNYV